MNRRRWQMVAAGSALLLMTAAPVEAGAGRATASAWALWVSIPGQDVVQFADVGATSGAVPTATATPISMAGTAPVAVQAGLDAPESSDGFGEYLDPTSSMSFAAGDAEARVDPSTAFGRASIGTGSGSGFSLADQLLTWEQQEQLLGAWAEANGAVFSAMNDLLAPLGPVLEPRNLVIPTLEPIAALGFVDVAGAELIASRAEGVTSDGFASASASTAVDNLRMFGGFIELEGISATAVAEQVGEVPSGRATATIGRLRIAGIEVEVSDEGLLAAGNDVVSKVVLQPIVDTILEQLDAAGIRLRVADVRDVDGVTEATAFEVEIITAQGMAIFSVGHAEAAAVAVAQTEPPLVSPPEESAPQPPAMTPREAVAPAVTPPVPVLSAPAPISVPESSTAVATPAAPATPATPTTEPIVAVRMAPLGAQAARSVSSAFVLLIGGLMAAMALPITLLVRPTRQRGRVLR